MTSGGYSGGRDDGMLPRSINGDSSFRAGNGGGGGDDCGDGNGGVNDVSDRKMRVYRAH